MTLNLKQVLGLGAIAVAMFATAFAIFSMPRIASAITSYSAPTLVDTFVNKNLLIATTTSATSTANSVADNQSVRLDGAEQATFYFSRGDTKGTGNTGSSKFEVEVSADGVTWVDAPRLLLNDLNKTASSTIWITAATSTVVAHLDLQDAAYHFARCQVVEVTDGEHSCAVSVEY